MTFFSLVEDRNKYDSPGILEVIDQALNDKSLIQAFSKPKCKKVVKLEKIKDFKLFVY